MGRMKDIAISLEEDKDYVPTPQKPKMTDLGNFEVYTCKVRPRLRLLEFQMATNKYDMAVMMAKITAGKYNEGSELAHHSVIWSVEVIQGDSDIGACIVGRDGSPLDLIPLE